MEAIFGRMIALNTIAAVPVQMIVVSEDDRHQAINIWPDDLMDSRAKAA